MELLTGWLLVIRDLLIQGKHTELHKDKFLQQKPEDHPFPLLLDAPDRSLPVHNFIQIAHLYIFCFVISGITVIIYIPCLFCRCEAM